MNEKWSIGEVAKLFEVSTDTLRYYEKTGLLPAHKQSHNGYRYYSYEEIVLLMDILFFRNMEIPVKEIKQMVTQMGIGDIKHILDRNESIVESRIQELLRLKQSISQAAKQYKLCEAWLGKYAFVAAPGFSYKLVSGQSEDLVDMLRKYRKEDWLADRVQYTLFVSQEALLSQPAFCSAQIGISVEAVNLDVLTAAEQQELTAFPAGEYLYTVLGTNYEEPRHEGLGQALEHLQANERKISGPLIGRYIASVHRDGLDYYEVWLPADKT
ncbi:MerR family DNA-binding transcriptional regulator [Propionispora hippei]|uniref:DNA-binding transcriptional regulator, MerR family n=1 Tax=Propionispora hippei DSM 15287 TaxID=1123003 RepID=A0A1M6H7M0_9FIRM|nr:MerR family transcriptional regulator [Propionispora hippei]SHJ18166.1 DNA-binding transcriptional regulator, MerR family [Propionispora hippei DSM 15287]